MKRALNKTAKCIRETIVSLVKSKPCKTITLDNGSEFAEYDQLETESKATVYFADTHSPWQRGSNENINELIRWYFPKGTGACKVFCVNALSIINRAHSRFT